MLLDERSRHSNSTVADLHESATSLSHVCDVYQPSEVVASSASVRYLHDPDKLLMVGASPNLKCAARTTMRSPGLGKHRPRQTIPPQFRLVREARRTLGLAETKQACAASSRRIFHGREGIAEELRIPPCCSAWMEHECQLADEVLES